MKDLRYYIGNLLYKVENMRDDWYFSKKVEGDEQMEKWSFEYNYHIDSDHIKIIYDLASLSARVKLKKKGLSEDYFFYYYYKKLYSSIVSYTFNDFKIFLLSFFMVC